MNKLLLKVEEVFTVSGRGVILTPDIPLEQKLPQSPVMVTLKRPDGSSIEVEAAFHIPHFQFAKVEELLKHLKNEQKYTCLLTGVEKSEVPTGTEIWLDSG
jgi:hypothetical protein